jgi:hypothetical protein
MTARTATITVTMNEDETLAIDATNQGMPLDRIGHGMTIALEGQILGKVALAMQQEVTQELRDTLADPIRSQAMGLFNEAPKINERNGMTTAIPDSMEVPDVES